MSDSEEEFASADEGDGDAGKASSETGKVTEVAKTKGQDHSKSSTGQNQPKSATGDSASSTNKQSSTEKTDSLSKPKKPDEKAVAKSKGKTSKQKRKEVNKNKKGVTEDLKEAATSKSVELEDSNTVGASVSESAVKDKTDTGQQKVPDPHTPETNSSVKASEIRTKLSEESTPEATEPIISSADQVKDVVKTESVVKDPSPDVTVEEQTIDRGGSESQNVDPEEDVSQPTPDTGQKKESSGWGGWSSWGTSLVSAATSSVSTFTNQVGEGFTTVLETVENTLGAPSPEELARLKGETTEKQAEQGETTEIPDGKEETLKKHADREKLRSEKPESDSSQSTEGGSVPSKAESEQSTGGGWLSGWGVSNLTSLVSDTSKTLVSGGLDVLETIGKKTYDALSEHDPGLKAVMKGENKPNLSSILREAKEQAAERTRLEEEFEESRQAHFGFMFDEYQGLVNLEALEMLSNQSETKIQSLLAGVQAEERDMLKQKLLQIKKAFELEELEDDDDDVEHDFPKLITDHLSEFHHGTSPAKLNAVQAKIDGWLTHFDSDSEATADPKEIHKVCIQSLAELTAKTVEQYHKAGELLLLQIDQGIDMLSRAAALASVTRVVCTEVGILSTKFTKCLNKVANDLEDTESINTFITNVYLEASNSSTYIQDAFQLLLPVVQQASVQESLGKS